MGLWGQSHRALACIPASVLYLLTQISFAELEVSLVSLGLDLNALLTLLTAAVRCWRNWFFYLFFFSLCVVCRLEICHDRRDWRSCKKFSSCVNFSRKQRVSLQNLCENMKFTHSFGKVTHTFTKKTMNIYVLISISTKKDQTKLFCSTVSKNNRNLRVFSM